MPKNKFQEVVFTIMMVIVMVYAMICYNIALDKGGLTNQVFIMALKELIIMCPIAFILEFFIVGKLAQSKAMKIVDAKNGHPFHIVIAISVVTVIWMCPLMSLAATVFFKHAGKETLAVWLSTTAFNFPMALCWQLFYAGPFVRFLFGKMFPEK